MSSLIINWRIGEWFLQVNPPRHWRHEGWGTLHRVPGRPRSGEPYCAFYQGTGYALLLALLVAVLIGWAVA